MHLIIGVCRFGGFVEGERCGCWRRRHVRGGGSLELGLQELMAMMMAMDLVVALGIDRLVDG